MFVILSQCLKKLYLLLFLYYHLLVDFFVSSIKTKIIWFLATGTARLRLCCKAQAWGDGNGICDGQWELRGRFVSGGDWRFEMLRDAMLRLPGVV